MSRITTGAKPPTNGEVEPATGKRKRGGTTTTKQNPQQQEGGAPLPPGYSAVALAQDVAPLLKRELTAEETAKIMTAVQEGKVKLSVSAEEWKEQARTLGAKPMGKEDVDRVLREIEEATKREAKAHWGVGVRTAYRLMSGVLIYMEENNPNVVPLTNITHLLEGRKPNQALVDALNFRLGLTPEDAKQVWQSAKDADAVVREFEKADRKKKR